jgi:uncharacterized membrane protein
MISADLKFFYVLAGVIFSALAQICMKQATLSEAGNPAWFLYILASITSYVFSFATYYLVLKYFAISRVAPVMTVGVLVIVVLYGIYSGEAVSGKHAAGLMLGGLSSLLILS